MVELVDVTRCDGTIEAVGSDYLEIAEHELGEVDRLSAPTKFTDSVEAVCADLVGLGERMVLRTDRHRVFFSGDTGLTESLREIARREGPFDVALFEIGQWNAAWGDIHLGPEGALEAHARLGAKVLIPIHWSTFVLAYHAWSEPAETLVRLGEARGVRLLTPGLGEPVEPVAEPAPVTTAWWRALPPIAAKCP